MPSRRDLIRMTPEELRAYIRSQKTLIIVSNGPTGYPHPLPMFFHVDDENRFYVTTFRKSQKVLNFQRDPKATLLIESGKVYSQLRSMIAYCTTEIIDDFATTLKIMDDMTRREVNAGDQPLSEEQKKATAAKRLILRFTPNEFITWDHTKLEGKY